MIALLPGSELGRVKRTVHVPVPGVESVREREFSGVPRPLIPALVQVEVLAVFAQLVPEALLPMSTLAQWWALPKRLVLEAQVLGVGQLLRSWVAVQIDQEVGREQGLIAVVWEQGESARVSLVDCGSDQKDRKDAYAEKGAPCYLSPR